MATTDAKYFMKSALLALKYELKINYMKFYSKHFVYSIQLPQTDVPTSIMENKDS